MGTNYYVKFDTCPTCGKAENSIHLGKSSYGWRFMFQYNEGRFYKNINEMKEWLADKKIVNEYGDRVLKSDFWTMVKAKQEDMPHGGTDIDLKEIKEYDFYDREFS